MMRTALSAAIGHQWSVAATELARLLIGRHGKSGARKWAALLSKEVENG